ncbi:MAG: response regulator [Promethearchaeota archaeon]
MTLINDKNKKKNTNEMDAGEYESPHLSEDEIENLDLNSDIVKKYMEQYQKETDKYAIWRGTITEGFKKWLKGEKIYDRDKERISLYVSEETKEKWQEFIKKYNYTISKLIREGVNYFIDQQSSKQQKGPLRLDKERLSRISHALKEPLTTIKGFSQLLIENYKEELPEDVLQTIRNIFEQSQLLENKIINILDNIKPETSQYDILLIEDDLATIKLLNSFFGSRGYSCYGVVSGSKGLEELENNMPKLILLDVILPDISGYEICKMIKNDERFKDIPIFLLTAIPGAEVEKKVKEIKADGFILKPFDFSEFEKIFKYLNKEKTINVETNN